MSSSARASSPARSRSSSWRRNSLAASARPLQYGATSTASSSGVGSGSSRTRRERAPRLGQLLLGVVERPARCARRDGRRARRRPPPRGRGPRAPAPRRRRTRRGASPGSTPRTPGSPGATRAIVISRARCFSSNVARARIADARRSPRAGPPRRLRRRAAAQRELGHAQLGHVAHLLGALGLRAAHVRPQQGETPASRSTTICSAHSRGRPGRRGEQQRDDDRERAPADDVAPALRRACAAVATGQDEPTAARRSARPRAAGRASTGAGRRRAPSAGASRLPLVRPEHVEP